MTQLQQPRMMFTSLPPDHAAAVLVQTLVASGAQITSQTERSVTGVMILRQHPSVVAAFFLLMLGVFPGILYLATAGRDVRNPFGIQLISKGQGCLVHPAGQDYGFDAAILAVSRLPD